MLKKLSLAALVAMGSMSFASASTDLSDAIKGVTIGGYLRYRYTEDNEKYYEDNKKDSDYGKMMYDNYTTNEYKAVVKTSIKASDTVSIHGTFVYKNKFNSSNTGDTQNNNANPFNVTETYINYVNAGANVKAGTMNLATPLSDHDDDRGNGLLATYTQAGITGAFGYFNDVTNRDGSTTLNNNLAVLAVIADIKSAKVQGKVQGWYYYLANSGNGNKDGKKALFLEASADLGAASVKAQYAFAKANAEDSDAQQFGAIAVTGKVKDVASVTVAGLKFGKKGSDVAVGTNNADALIAAGDILSDQIQENGSGNGTNMTNGYGLALVVKTKVGSFTPGIQLVHATDDEVEGGAKSSFNEYDADLAYQYNKKLKISGYYAVLKANYDEKPHETQNQGRVEVKYSF